MSPARCDEWRAFFANLSKNPPEGFFLHPVYPGCLYGMLADAFMGGLEGIDFIPKDDIPDRIPGVYIDAVDDENLTVTLTGVPIPGGRYLLRMTQPLPGRARAARACELFNPYNTAADAFLLRKDERSLKRWPTFLPGNNRLARLRVGDRFGVEVRAYTRSFRPWYRRFYNSVVVDSE